MWRLLIFPRVRPGHAARIGAKFLVILLAALLAVSTARAAPPAQDPRGNGGGGGPAGGGRDGQRDENGKPLTCAALKGQVLNWGFGPQPDVVVTLETGSWQVSAASATDGSYGFGGLGVGMAKLHVALPPGLAETLKPLIQDAGVYLSCDFPTIANLAVYSGDVVQPPATISASATGRLTPGGQASLRLLVKNNLPTPITNVIVTDLMEPGLLPLDVQAAGAQVIRILDGGPDGHLVVVYLDSLASGAEVNLFITVTADPDAPTGARLNSRATLFYRESVAHQAGLDFIVGQGAVVSPEEVTIAAPQTGATPAASPEASPTPLPEPTATPSPEPTPEAEAFMPPPEQIPTTGEDLIPPGLLPTTGDFAAPSLLPETGVGLWLPLSGLGLMGLAFLAHFWRMGGRRRE